MKEEKAQNYDPLLLYFLSPSRKNGNETFFSLLNFLCDFNPKTFVINNQ